IATSGVLSIAAARITRIHPAYFFLLSGAVLPFVLPFTFPSQSLLVELAEVGALFVVFLAALEIEWDLRFVWQARTIFTSLVLQAMTILPVMAIMYFFITPHLSTALTVAFLAAMHAPDRRQSKFSESFRADRVASDVAFMGFTSEVSALLAIAVLSAYTKEITFAADIVKSLVGVVLMLLVLISIFPPLIRFLVRRVGEESYAFFYLLLLLLIVVVGVLIRVDIEPLFGIYAAGFVLKRFISEGSRALERMRFTGHSMIVPAFYIALGIAGALFSSFQADALVYALSILLTTLIARAAFAYIVRMRDRRTRISLSQLIRKNPLVLVLVYIAYARGLISSPALHTVLYYLILNEVLAVYLNRFQRSEKREPLIENNTRILVPVANPESMMPLLTLAGHMGHSDAPAKIFPLNVVPDTTESAMRIRRVEAQFQELKKLYATREEDLELTARIDNDRIHAVTHAARELITEKIILGLGQITTLQKPHGYSFLDTLAEKATQQTVIAAHLPVELAVSTELNVLVANERMILSQEIWLPIVLNLSRRLKATPVFLGEAQVLPHITEYLNELDPRRKYPIRAGNLHAGLDLLTLSNNDSALWIAILERPAFAPEESIHVRLPEMMLRAFSERNFLLLYPQMTAIPKKFKKSKKGTWRRVKNFFGFSKIIF
ncbi:MAG TPA: cation:proton antiporter, partial [Turneriella sp.]|nr:cation:proton antiporter [Turneriella sp.]